MNMKSLAKVVAIGAAVVGLSMTGAIALEAEANGAVNVRSGPGTSYRVLDQLRAGEMVDVSDRTGRWCLISKSGPDGWVSCRFLTAFDDSGRYDSGRYRYRDGPDVSVTFGFGTFGGWGNGHHRHHDHNDGPNWPGGWDHMSSNN